MGTPEFGAAMLQELLNEERNVVAAVTQPDKLVGRKQILTFSAVKKLALEHEIPVIQPLKIRDEYEEVLAYKPDLIVTCAYGQFVPRVILEAPRLGCINVHASLLPKLRGGAPIQHAIIDGYETTGITIMEMAIRMDAGNIISRREVTIEDNDTYGSLHDRLMVTATELLRDTMPSVLEGSYESLVQDEEEATFGYNITKEEEHVDLTRSYRQVYNQIRGLIPVPCSYILVDGKKYKLWNVSETDREYEAENGTLVVDKGLFIAVDNRLLEILELQPEGRSQMKARDFINGAGRGFNGRKAE